MTRKKTEIKFNKRTKKLKFFSWKFHVYEKKKLNKILPKKTTNIQDTNHFDLQCFDEKKTQAEIFFCCVLKKMSFKLHKF